MPLYDYMCPECEHVQEEFHGMNEKPEITCPSCGHLMNKAFFTAPHGHVNEIRTVGQLADYNTRRMSTEERQRVLEESKTQPTESSELPEGMTRAPRTPRRKQWYDKFATKKTKEVAQMTPDRIKKYVHTGE